jgi:hypothetical protein
MGRFKKVCNYRTRTHFVDEQRDRLRELSDRLQSERGTLSDLDQHLEQQRELRSRAYVYEVQDRSRRSCEDRFGR